MSPFLETQNKKTQSATVSTPKQAHTHVEEECQAHLTFLENMDKINRAIQEAGDLDQMMSAVLTEVLSIFDCDRAWLLYPCDPEVTSFRVPMEITKPEYPGAKVFNVDVPLSPNGAKSMREALASSDPVTYTAGTERPVDTATAEQFGVQSQMFIAIHPKSGKSWLFGVHQCSYPRLWKEEEKELFQEISRRMADALSSLLLYRDLQKSEEQYRRIIETAAEGIWIIDKERKTTFVNALLLSELGYTEEEILGKKADDFVVEEELAAHERQMEARRHGKSGLFERRIRRKDGGIVWYSVSAAPMFDEKKEFAGSFAMLTDITKRKEAEREKAEYVQGLEHMNTIMVGRELKMIEMKKEIEDLQKRIESSKESG